MPLTARQTLASRIVLLANAVGFMIACGPGAAPPPVSAPAPPAIPSAASTAPPAASTSLTLAQIAARSTPSVV